MDEFIAYILRFLPTFLTVIAVIAVYYAIKWLLDRQAKGKSDRTLIRSIVLFCILLIGSIAIIMALPMSDTLRSLIINLTGIVISAVLALSSATFIGNGFAGIMIRTVNSFRPGDFIQVNDHFGRITERGLFHSEIQNEERDLITLPNLYLVTNPVKVTRSSGTFIHGTCSLGYDVNRLKIEKALLKATEKAELSDAFVRIIELGDYSVVYRVYGMVENIKTFLSAQSRLNAMILDCLHEAGIEIVSPAFMNQRQIGDTVFIPKKARPPKETGPTEHPEELIFDKADEAESIEKRREKLADIDQKLKELNDELKEAGDEAQKEALLSKINRWKAVRGKWLEKIDDQLNEMNSKK